MGIPYRKYLDGRGRVWACSECKTHLTGHDDLMSKAFQGHYGRAWLFHTVVNVIEGPPSDRPMTTGKHTVKDISCNVCGTSVGWKYEKAWEEDQKYKEGKFILEKTLLCEIVAPPA